MRENIVVPDTIEKMIEFAPMHANMCSKLPAERYCSAKSPEGVCIAESITRIHDLAMWCSATLSGNTKYTYPARLISQDRILAETKKAFSALERALHKSEKTKKRTEYHALPDVEYEGAIALRRDAFIDWTVILYQVMQYHLRRAFYTFNRDSGFLFPGGDRSYLKIYDGSVLRHVCPLPIATGRKS